MADPLGHTDSGNLSRMSADHRGELGATTVTDAVEHPSHYNQVPGVECISVVEHFNFNRGNTIKYIWRAGSKGDEVEDLRKAKQYLDFEIDRITRGQS